MRRKIFKVILVLIIISNVIINTTQASNEQTQNQNVYSDYAILIDNNSGEVLYTKNAYQKTYPASTTKILTAIIAIENCELTDVATVSKTAVAAIPSGYASAYLSVGEEITVKDLLTVFLVHSANDAGYVLAEHISGSVSDFADLMNKKALEIGCKDTHFKNPSGIHDPDHYTTAYDLALIAKYCMKNSTFRNIVSMEKCTIGSTNKAEARTYINTNDLLNKSSKYYLKECIGIKTGYTVEAKNCLISACSKNNMELICVVLGANQLPSGESSRYLDSINIFKYGYSNYSVKQFGTKDDVIKNIEISNGTKDTRNLDLILKDDIYGLIKNNSEIPEPDVKLNENLLAPIAKNAVVGSVTYTIGETSYTQDLIAANDVIGDSFLLLIFKILLVLTIIFTLIVLWIPKFKKKRKRKRKYSRRI